MDKFKRTLSLKKKKDVGAESSKPHQWQEDERKVREGCCSFHVKYLGCIEVFESRGIQVCEEAVKALKNKKSRSFWSKMSLRRKKKDDSQQSKSGHHLAVLYVTGDALRVVDEISKGLIVDQTIEKVSFCAPDRNHDRGFAYICRDGTTRRWMCHGFLAIKESGERLSHAVGCAFAICLEKKQQREKEKVSVTYNDNGTSFTRLGSFRQTSVTERLADPQSAIVAEPIPSKPASNPFAVQRPHAPADMLERQGSFRSFQKLADSSPFKRNISLRLNELPSNLERQKHFTGLDGPQLINGRNTIGTILEAEEQDPFSPSPPLDSFANIKLDISHSNIPFSSALPKVVSAKIAFPLSAVKEHIFPSSTEMQSLPITQSNPWAENERSHRASEAESWLNATASKIDPFACVPNNNAFSARLQPQFDKVDSFTPLTSQQSTSPQASYPLQQGISGHVGEAKISSCNSQFYPASYQIFDHVPHQCTGISVNSLPYNSHIPSQEFVAANMEQISSSTAFCGTPVTQFQNIQPAATPQHSALDPFLSGNVWPSATNPFKAGSDAPSFQLKI